MDSKTHCWPLDLMSKPLHLDRLQQSRAACRGNERACKACPQSKEQPATLCACLGIAEYRVHSMHDWTCQSLESALSTDALLPAVPASALPYADYG